MSDPNVPPPRPSLSDNVPSSFDDDPDFFEERRLQKLWRRLKEEPLIPVGCAATVYALYQATNSIRAGDHHQTNRMFRARIYAQGFTLVAVVAGSIFYKDDRLKRKKFETALEDKKAAEKRDKWIKELELRDQEDREWRERFEGVAQRAKEAEQEVRGEVMRDVKIGAGVVQEKAEKGKKGVKEAIDKTFQNRSVMEEIERTGWGPGLWVARTREAWRRR